MADVVVVGFGSELRRDDAAGRRVADAIERRRLPGVTVLTCTQLVPELAESLARTECVVFVDASLDADRIAVRELLPAAVASDSHHATPSGLLGLVRSLGLRCPRAILVEIPAFDLSLGEGLSRETTAAVEPAVDAVIDVIPGGEVLSRARAGSPGRDA